MSQATEVLGQLAVGASCTIESVQCARPLARRLMEMGLLPGTEVKLSRIAPLGDPLELRVRNFALSIRRSEAMLVRVRHVTTPRTEVAAVPEHCT